MARSADPCEITASAVVTCSVQECWDLYIDNTEVCKWSPAVREVECNTALVTKGTRRKSHVHVDGKSGYTVEQCTTFEPLKRIEFSVIEETFGFSHMLNSYGFGLTFDVEGENTLLVMKTHYTPKKIFASVMSSKATQQQLANLMEDMLNGFKQFAQVRTIQAK